MMSGRKSKAVSTEKSGLFCFIRIILFGSIINVGVRLISPDPNIYYRTSKTVNLTRYLQGRFFVVRHPDLWYNPTIFFELGRGSVGFWNGKNSFLFSMAEGSEYGQYGSHSAHK